jgi:hypothetical protein
VKLAPKGSSVGGLPEWKRSAAHRLGRRRHGHRDQPHGHRHQLHVPVAAGRHVAGPRTAGTERTSLTIWLPGQNPPNATYSFTVGDWSNPLHPAKVEIVHDPGTFVNTGRMFLHGFDYLYDAAGGYVGYSWTGRTNPAYGSVAIGR